jgi:hypothetical protein
MNYPYNSDKVILGIVRERWKTTDNDALSIEWTFYKSSLTY